MFDGWYLSTGDNAIKWTGDIVGDTSVIDIYAKWLPFEDKVVTLS